MHFDLLGFIVLFFALIVVSLIQAGLALGAMYAMHKYWEQKLTEKLYAGFDFDNFQKAAFQEMVTRLVLVFFTTTMVLHLLYYLLIGRSRYEKIFYLILFVLEMAGIVAGLQIVFKLDWLRLAVLGASSAFIYLFVLAFLHNGKFLI